MPEPAVAEQQRASFDDLYARQWWPMLRLAVGLVDDRSAAEDVVQEAFTAIYRRWSRIESPDAAIGYLRVAVVNTSRNVLRRRRTVRRHQRTDLEPPGEAADHTTLLAADHAAVRRALDQLPHRQREVILLRFVAELDDEQIAAATGLTTGGVRSASSRGLAALRTALGRQL